MKAEEACFTFLLHSHLFSTPCNGASVQRTFLTNVFLQLISLEGKFKMKGVSESVLLIRDFVPKLKDFVSKQFV